MADPNPFNPENKSEKIEVTDFPSYTEVLTDAGQKKLDEVEGTPEVSAVIAKLQLFGANNEYVAPVVASHLEQAA